tara:strand:+ start:41 stop:862 length:822 start_codon:yes stop_codon:yes gene_type:complete
MNEKWLSLRIKDNSNLEIIGSYFDSYSLGSQIDNDEITMYFFIDDKEKIENIILDINRKYKFKHNWGSLEPQNWMNKWKDFFTPVEIKQNVLIIPDWDQNIYPHKYLIKICPAMAFGTGHHASTQLVIEHMLDYDIGKKKTLLDLGTGSGILSILAQKMGVLDIVSIDIDSVCEDNFHQNCKLSNVPEINFIISDVHDYDNYDYGIILANIDKKNIVKILDKYQKSDSEALLILAGLLDSDLDDIKDCMKSCFIDNMKQKDEWVSLAIKKYDK